MCSSDLVGFRRGVPATVPALRDAGSTTIARADTKEKLGIVVVFLTPIAEAIKAIFGPVDVPHFATLQEGFGWWTSVMGTANGLLAYAVAHPWLAATLFCGLGLWALARLDKAKRVAEHAAGIPIAAEVAKLGTA